MVYNGFYYIIIYNDENLKSYVFYPSRFGVLIPARRVRRRF